MGGWELVKWKREKRKREEREETIIRTACETSESNIVPGGASGGLDTSTSQPTILGQP